MGIDRVGFLLETSILDFDILVKLYVLLHRKWVKFHLLAGEFIINGVKRKPWGMPRS